MIRDFLWTAVKYCFAKHVLDLEADVKNADAGRSNPCISASRFDIISLLARHVEAIFENEKTVSISLTSLQAPALFSVTASFLPVNIVAVSHTLRFL
jgi:hypothetical protein